MVDHFLIAFFLWISEFIFTTDLMALLFRRWNVFGVPTFIASCKAWWLLYEIINVTKIINRLWVLYLSVVFFCILLIEATLHGNKKKRSSLKFEKNIYCFLAAVLKMELNVFVYFLQMTKEVTSSRPAMNLGDRMTYTCDWDYFWESEEGREVNREKAAHRSLRSTRILLRPITLVRWVHNIFFIIPFTDDIIKWECMLNPCKKLNNVLSRATAYNLYLGIRINRNA